MVKMDNEWDIVLRGEFDKNYYQSLRSFLAREYTEKTVYPNMHDIFNALKYTSYSEVKAVIIGQDPYHGFGQAHGLSFSVKPGIAVPPSLQNMYKELNSDIGFEIPNHGYLVSWAERGVLLLNNVLTVRKDEANSHRSCGWETFTDEIIRNLNKREKPIVFLLWGNNAKTKDRLITNPQHFILTAAHPSPLSAYNGFFGCKHFSKANDRLKMTGQTPIDWSLPKEI